MGDMIKRAAGYGALEWIKIRHGDGFAGPGKEVAKHLSPQVVTLKRSAGQYKDGARV